MIDKKISEIQFKKIESKYKAEIKEYYLNVLDEILTPILEVENQFLNDESSNFLLVEDFEEMVKEVLSKTKKYKFVKCKLPTFNEYLKRAIKNNLE